MIFKNLLFIIVAILLATPSLAASNRAKCSFDTLADTSPYVMQEMEKIYASDSMNKEGWRTGYQLNSNPGISLYIGHKSTPQISNFEMVEYLHFLGSSVSSIENDLSQRAISLDKKINVDTVPYFIIVESVNSDDIKSEYIQYQVGNDCSLIFLLRTPQNSLNSSQYISLKNEIETMKQYSFSLMGPISLKESKFIPTGFAAVSFGLILPAILFLLLVTFLNKIQLYNNSRFTPQQKLIMILFPSVSYLYLSMVYGMNMLSSDEFVGVEIVSYFVLSTILLFYWGIIGKHVTIPIGVLFITFLITLLYSVMGWYIFPLYAFIAMIISLISVIIVMVMGHMSELEALENRGRYSKNRSHFKMD